MRAQEVAKVFGLVGFLLAISSSCGDSPKEPHKQSVERLHALPGALHVAPGDAVILTARLLTGSDSKAVIPEWKRDPVAGDDTTPSKHTVHWKLIPDTEDLWFSDIGSPGRHRILLSVRPDAAPQSLKIQVRAGGKEDSLEVHVDEPAPGSSVGGSIADPNIPGADGLRLLTERTLVDSGSRWEIRAYSSSFGPKDMLTSSGQFAAEFEGNRELAFYFPPATDPQSPPTVLDLPLRFWLASAGLNVSEIGLLTTRISEDLEVANQIFAENRTGISFRNADGAGTTKEIHTVADLFPRACPGLLDEMEALDSPDKPDLKLHLLHVVYLQGRASDTSNRGIECAYDEDPRTGTGFVVVWLNNRAPTSLAHELGHALGLNQRTDMTDGHANGPLEGFDAGNLMWSYLKLQQATDRGRILAGQALWMNVFDLSFLNLALKNPDSSGTELVRPDDLPQQCCTPGGSECAALNVRMEGAQ